MAEHTGMVLAGAKPLNEAEVSSGAYRGNTYRAEKIFATEMSRAAERHQKTPIRHCSHRGAIEFGVELCRARNVFEAAGERRWIEHNDIELLVALTQVLRRLVANQFIALWRPTVEL